MPKLADNLNYFIILLGISSSSVCSRRNITRAFLSYGETKCPEIRTHYHFHIIFSLDSRTARRHFDNALAKAFQLECDEIVTIDTPDQEFLISIPNKQQNKQAVEFLQSEQRLNLGNIYFTTLCADENSTFCGTPAYDFNDNHAGSQVLVEITNLPLQLWTFKTVDLCCIHIVSSLSFTLTQSPTTIFSRSGASVGHTCQKMCHC